MDNFYIHPLVANLLLKVYYPHLRFKDMGLMSEGKSLALNNWVKIGKVSLDTVCISMDDGWGESDVAQKIWDTLDGQIKDIESRRSVEIEVTEINGIPPHTNVFHYDFSSMGMDIGEFLGSEDRVMVMKGLSRDTEFILVDESTGRRWKIKLPKGVRDV